MDLFERYEAEFTQKMMIVRQRIDQLSNFSGERRKVVVSETQRQIDELRKLYKYMEEELIQKDHTVSKSKMRTFASDLTRVEKDLERANLVGGSYQKQDDSYLDDYQVKEVDQRRKLIENTGRVDESTQRLMNAHRIAIETEDIGTSVVNELSSQKQTLLRTRDNLNLIDDNMTRSRRILSAMSRRIITNNFILVGIILILLLAIILVSYLKWIRHFIN